MPWRNNPYLALRLFNQTKRDALAQRVCIKCIQNVVIDNTKLATFHYFQNALCENCAEDWYETHSEEMYDRLIENESDVVFETATGGLITFEDLKTASKSATQNMGDEKWIAQTFAAVRLIHLLSCGPLLEQYPGSNDWFISRFPIDGANPIASIGGRETQLTSARWFYWSNLFRRLLDQQHPETPMSPSLEKGLLFPEILGIHSATSPMPEASLRALQTLFGLELHELDLMRNGMDPDKPPVRWTEIITGQCSNEYLAQLTRTIALECLDTTRDFLEKVQP